MLCYHYFEFLLGWKLHLIVHIQNILRGKENLVPSWHATKTEAKKLNLFLEDTKLSSVL